MIEQGWNRRCVPVPDLWFDCSSSSMLKVDIWISPVYKDYSLDSRWSTIEYCSLLEDSDGREETGNRVILSREDSMVMNERLEKVSFSICPTWPMVPDWSETSGQRPQQPPKRNYSAPLRVLHNDFERDEEMVIVPVSSWDGVFWSDDRSNSTPTYRSADRADASCHPTVDRPTIADRSERNWSSTNSSSLSLANASDPIRCSATMDKWSVGYSY